MQLHACVRDSGQEKPRKRRNVFRQAYAYDALSDSWQPTPVRPESCLGPGPNYIAPSSSFFFPEVSSSANEFLPPHNVSDQLVAQYLLAVHPIARVVHRPTFEKQYVLFWDSFTNGVSPPAPIQAVIFAALFSAAVSLTDPMAQRLTGMPRAMLIDRLRTTTEMSLSRARFLQTAKLDTLQAFVMYMLPLCRDDVSRAHSSLVGAAIRLAQCMGLHKDGTSYNFTAVDTHVRRLIWYQLIYLDVRTCEATGPRPQIRKDEYDTELPLNVNDEDLLSPSPPTEDSPMWTEMTLTKMKFECYDVIRQLWDDMPQIDRKKTSLTSVLGKIQRFRASTGAKYVALMQGTMPLQVLGRNIYRMLSNRCFLIVLQRYAVSPLVHPMPQMPERLRQILVEAATSATESGVAFDTHPLLKTWSWYRPALLQYHGCLLMLLEVYERPDIPEAPRIWACVDYVFELRSDLSPVEKAEGVLLELSNRLGVYHNMRKMKLATSIDDRSSANDSIGPVEDNTRQLARLQQAASARIEAISHGSPLDGPGSHPGTSAPQEDSSMHAMTDIDWVRLLLSEALCATRSVLIDCRMNGKNTFLRALSPCWAILMFQPILRWPASILTTATLEFRIVTLLDDHVCW